jgi:cyclohexadieny/prephenate dehydrogenase
MFNRVAFLGIGLIASSMACAMRQQGLARTYVAAARRAETCATALRLGLVEEASTDPVASVKGADLVVLATPVSAYADLMRQIAPHLAPGAIVTDVGSVKGQVVADVAPLLPEGVHFVPAHPIAGTEHSGPESGFAELFQNRWCILTPSENTDVQAIDKISELWRRFGSKVDIMTPAHHDQVLAITSHLPHLIAYTIVGTAVDLEGALQNEVIKYSASGFRDFTRIAASDPVMWRDIFLSNREAVLEMLGRFTEDLAALQKAIRWGDAETLEALFTRTRAIRRGIVEAGQA